jgi:hypothetical protein
MDLQALFGEPAREGINLAYFDGVSEGKSSI